VKWIASAGVNVYRMKMLGAEVVPVSAGPAHAQGGGSTRPCAIWVTHVRSTHCNSSARVRAHPYPVMVRNFQRVIGDEARRQILEKEQSLP
jgi:tryptophan synthase beta chain